MFRELMIVPREPAIADEKLVYEPLRLHADPYPLYRRLRDEAPVYADPFGTLLDVVALRRHAGGGA